MPSTKQTITVHSRNALYDSHLRKLEQGDLAAVLIPHPDCSQVVRIDFWMDDFRVCVADANASPVNGPGFVVPSRPEADTDWGDDPTTRLIPAAIGWLGVRGDYGSQTAPGMIVLAAEVAEQVAAEVSDPASWRAVEVMEEAKRDVAAWEAQRIESQEYKAETIVIAREWADAMLDADTDPASVRVRVTIPVDYKRSGRDTIEVTLDRVLNGTAGWLSDESALVEAQVKPRGKWHVVLSRATDISADTKGMADLEMSVRKAAAEAWAAHPNNSDNG